MQEWWHPTPRCFLKTYFLILNKCMNVSHLEKVKCNSCSFCSGNIKRRSTSHGVFQRKLTRVWSDTRDGCKWCGTNFGKESWSSSSVKALSHGAIFLATCNAILLSGDAKLANTSFHQFANILLTYQTFVTNLHLWRVELRCKLREKLHRVTGP